MRAARLRGREAPASKGAKRRVGPKGPNRENRDLNILESTGSEDTLLFPKIKNNALNSVKVCYVRKENNTIKSRVATFDILFFF